MQLDPINRSVWGGNPGNVSDYLTFKLEALAPFIDYLDEKLDEQQGMLSVIVRYKKRCEWFNSEALRETADAEKAKAENEKGRAEVEKVLKQDLYRYLHDQGIDFTIEPKAPGSEIDLILDQEAGSRKYLEGKVFDNQHRNSGYLIKGFGQLLRYLRQYNVRDGYLFVYKTCEETLEITGAELLQCIPFIRCDNKTIFVTIIELNGAKPASKTTYEPIRISVQELQKADTSDSSFNLSDAYRDSSAVQAGQNVGWGWK